MKIYQLTFSVFFTATIRNNSTKNIPDAVNILITGSLPCGTKNDITQASATHYVNGHRAIPGKFLDKLKEIDSGTAAERLKSVGITNVEGARNALISLHRSGRLVFPKLVDEKFKKDAKTVKDPYAFLATWFIYSILIPFEEGEELDLEKRKDLMCFRSHTADSTAGAAPSDGGSYILERLNSHENSEASIKKFFANNFPWAANVNYESSLRNYFPVVLSSYNKSRPLTGSIGSIYYQSRYNVILEYDSRKYLLVEYQDYKGQDVTGLVNYGKWDVPQISIPLNFPGTLIRTYGSLRTFLDGFLQYHQPFIRCFESLLTSRLHITSYEKEMISDRLSFSESALGSNTPVACYYKRDYIVKINNPDELLGLTDPEFLRGYQYFPIDGFKENPSRGTFLDKEISGAVLDIVRRKDFNDMALVNSLDKNHSLDEKEGILLSIRPVPSHGSGFRTLQGSDNSEPEYIYESIMRIIELSLQDANIGKYIPYQKGILGIEQQNHGTVTSFFNLKSLIDLFESIHAKIKEYADQKKLPIVVICAVTVGRYFYGRHYLCQRHPSLYGPAVEEMDLTYEALESIVSKKPAGECDLIIGLPKKARVYTLNESKSFNDYLYRYDDGSETTDNIGTDGIEAEIAGNKDGSSNGILDDDIGDNVFVVYEKIREK